MTSLSIATLGRLPRSPLSLGTLGRLSLPRAQVDYTGIKKRRRLIDRIRRDDRDIVFIIGEIMKVIDA